MHYVALLRGINVGGKSPVPMQLLRDVFEKNGCNNVTTYINSGNVLFSDTRSELELQKILEVQLQNEVTTPIPIYIRSYTELQKLCSLVPSEWQNDSEQRTDVLFIDETVDPSQLSLVANPLLDEQILQTEREIIWHIPRKYVTKGNGIKIVNTPMYKHMTIRNINTVRALLLRLENR